MSDAAPPAPVRAEGLLAKPRGGGLHLRLPAAPLRAPRLRVRRRDRRRARRGRAARRSLRLRRRQHGVRAGSRSSSSAGARRACSSGCARRRSAGRLPRCRAALDARDVRAAVGRACSCSAASAFDASMPANWLGFVGAIVLGVACFAGLGLAARGAHPLGGGRVGRRQRRRAADGVPLGLVRPDAGLPGRSCRRSPTCSRSRTSSTSSTASTSTATRSSPIRRRSLIVLAWGARRASSSPCGASAGCRASAER